MYKLTVGIPTYNGEKTILESLESVLAYEADFQPFKLEVLVCDNASEDKTQEIVNQFSKRCTFEIRYHQHSSNIGYDRNVHSIFEHAKGEYVHILADDDVINEDFFLMFQKVLNTSPQPVLILNNFDLYDHEMKKLIHRMHLIPPDIIICSSIDDFLSKSHGRYGLVSSLTIQRQKWMDVNPIKAFGTQYIHIFAMFRILSYGPSAIVNTPTLKARHGSRHFEKVSADGILVPSASIRLIKDAKSLIQTVTYNRLIKEQRRYVYNRFLLMLTSKDRQVLKVLPTLIRDNFDDWRVWGVLAASFLPTSLLGCLRKFTRKRKLTNSPL